MPRKTIENIGPQEGKQEAFLASTADIVIYGGSAGSGKSYSLLLMPLYYTDVPGFNAIIFRRTFSEITTPGGLWDGAQEVYNKVGGKCRGKPEYTASWSSGAKVVFRHLEYESDVNSHHGGQYCFIGFDELCTFTRHQFFYLMSRNRSGCGVKPFIRATCNPDSESWVKPLIQWWLDEDTGFPIEERSGVIKYFTAEGNELKWVDKDWRDPRDPRIGPKSFTFIPALMDDNPILVKANPEYKASLLSLSKVDRDRLLYGNWNSKPEDGMFKPEWFVIKDELPVATTRKIRVWDRANTEKDEKNRNPDYTAGIKGFLSGDTLCIEDLQHFRASPAKNEEILKATAEADGRDTEIEIEREPASSGKDVFYHYRDRILKDFIVRDYKPDGKRTALAATIAAKAERRRIWLKNAPWNKAFINELGNFPPSSGAGHDDITIATAQLDKALSQELRVISGYSSKNLTDQKVLPEGIDYAAFFQEKDLRLYGCFFRWDYKARILYCYDEVVMQGFTIPQVKQVILDKCRGIATIHCNDMMNKEGDSVARLLARENVILTESPRFNDEGSVAVVSQMFATMNIFISVICVETDRQIRSWMLDGGKPQDTRIGCAKCLCMVISDLRDKKKIEPPPPPKPYSREKIADSVVPTGVTVGKTTVPTVGYSRRSRHWMY